jgi:hypothetical protein
MNVMCIMKTLMTGMQCVKLAFQQCAARVQEHHGRLQSDCNYGAKKVLAIVFTNKNS